jgi:hypothetical protein
MRKRLGMGLLASLVAVGLLSASPAAAATEFGDNCIGDESIESPITLFQISSTGAPLPSAAPVSGVITKWKSNLIPAPVTVPVTLKLLRLSGTNAQIVGEASGSITGGTNSFDTRLPVQAGDHLGFFGPSEFGPIVCEKAGGTSLLGAFEGGGGGVGSTTPFVSIPPSPLRIPLYASIEPDADLDGYGDETQDLCPQSAAVQVACPIVALGVSTTVKEKSVTVIVTASTAASVTVTGVVGLGKGGKARLKLGPKAVKPGSFTKFNLRFPAELKDRLKELPPKKKLTLKLTSSAPNIAAAPSKKTVRVKLKGQG